jgi:hypothetical protein
MKLRSGFPAAREDVQGVSYAVKVRVNCVTEEVTGGGYECIARSCMRFSLLFAEDYEGNQMYEVWMGGIRSKQKRIENSYKISIRETQ